MKRKLSWILVLSLLLVSLVGCGSKDGPLSTYKSVSFDVDTGDRIKLKLVTSGGYDMNDEVPVQITKDGELQCDAGFMSANKYKENYDVAKADSRFEIVDTGEKDSNEYYVMQYGDKEFYVAIKVAGTNTGVLLRSKVSMESILEVFDRLTITEYEE